MGILYSYRTSTFMRGKEYLLYAGGCLFIMGLGLRELALNWLRRRRAAFQRVDRELQRRRDVVAEAGVVLADLRDRLAPTLDVDGEQFGEVVVADVETGGVEGTGGGQQTDGRLHRRRRRRHARRPLQHAAVLAEPGKEPAVLGAANQLTNRAGRLAGSLVLPIDSQWSKYSAML